MYRGVAQLGRASAIGTLADGRQGSSGARLSMFVYILKSEKDNSLYVGSARNVEQRLENHNKGQSLATKAKKPWILARVEKYNSVSLALKREKFLKSGIGRKVLENLLD